MASKEIKADRGGHAFDVSGLGNRVTLNVNHVARFSSHLNPLLERIIKNYDPDAATNNSDELPDPDDKLDFNSVRVLSENIIGCVDFLTLVEDQVDAIDDESPGAKNKFLKAIHQNYKNHRSELLINKSVSIKNKESVISTIRQNSDLLLQQVTNSILHNAETDLHGCPLEDVLDSVYLIVCYGFINCKILERPNDY
jgi:hypothetical protein|tara:strand:- start:837 stop:1427 length:591 start_codon:yes stop_codon:yes gene_type:complete